MSRKSVASTAPFQDLLVLGDSTPAGAAALAYADAIAGDGHVACLLLGYLAPYPVTIYMEATPDIWLQAQRKAEEMANAAEVVVRGAIAKLSRPVEFRRRDVMGGQAGVTLGIEGRYADALVIGWPKAAAAQERDMFVGALFNSGSPVIVVPEGWSGDSAPRRILVAWSPEKEAARAVRDALPLLRRAEEVRLVAVSSGDPTGEEEPGSDMARHLARHDVKVHVKQALAGGKPIAEVLTDEARFLGADLIVMGGYGHSRLREWIMGGVTRDILLKLPAPILFSH